MGRGAGDFALFFPFFLLKKQKCIGFQSGGKKVKLCVSWAGSSCWPSLCWAVLSPFSCVAHAILLLCVFLAPSVHSPHHILTILKCTVQWC